MQQQQKKTVQEGKPPTAIFTLMTLTNILINLDHGILPACTNQLKAQFKMDETELGILGSIVYLGIVIMGMFAGRLYQHINSKLLTLIALIALEVTLLLFVLSDHQVTAYLSRFFTGVCQVFLLVYYPIWIDKFGFSKKTLWLTLLQICVPVGIFAGYGITAIVIAIGFNYKASFYIQIVLVAGFIIAFVMLSKQKLDSRRKLSEEFTQPLIGDQRNSLLTSERSSVVMTEAEKKKKYEFMDMAKKLIKSKMYLVGTLTMSVILYVSTGIQFWLTDYYINVLGFNRQAVNIAYAVVSITGPTSGCGFGGYVINKIGGYDNPKSVYYVLIFSSIGIGSALIIPFVDEFYTLGVLLWIVLFFGGAMMPGLTGIMMSSVSPYLRAFGNSNGEIIKNIFGYLPSPFVYGLFKSLYGDRAGIKVLMFWGLWAPILLGYGSFHKWRQLRKLKAHQIKGIKEKQTSQQALPFSDQEDNQAQSKDIMPNPENKDQISVEDSIQSTKIKDQPSTTADEGVDSK